MVSDQQFYQPPSISVAVSAIIAHGVADGGSEKPGHARAGEASAHFMALIQRFAVTTGVELCVV